MSPLLLSPMTCPVVLLEDEEAACFQPPQASHRVSTPSVGCPSRSPPVGCSSWVPTVDLLRVHNYRNLVKFRKPAELFDYLLRRAGRRKNPAEGSDLRGDGRFGGPFEHNSLDGGTCSSMPLNRASSSPFLLLLDLDATVDGEGILGGNVDVPSGPVDGGTRLLSRVVKAVRELQIDVVLIALSSRSEVVYLRQCVHLGADDVLVRPLESQVVKTLWLNMLRRRHLDPPGSTQNYGRRAILEVQNTGRAKVCSTSITSPTRLIERISDLHCRTAHVTSLFIGESAPSTVIDGILRRKSLPASYPRPTHYALAELPLAELASEKKRLFYLLEQWDFNPRCLSDELEVVRCVALVLEHAAEVCGGLGAIGLSQSSLHRFIVAVRSAYYADNPYHNFNHGVDVMQAIYVFLLRMGILKSYGGTLATDITNGNVEDPPAFLHMLPPQEVFALLVAALCHDLGHPGVNNAYMISSKSSLAELYNDSSVLENFHAAGFFALMRRERIQFFPSASAIDEFCRSDLYKDFRRIVTTSILATDMARHAEYVAKLRQHGCKFRPPKSGITCQERLTEDERTLLAGVLLKCADISNPTRPFPVAMSWSSALLEEFQMQSRVDDHNRRLGAAHFRFEGSSLSTNGDTAQLSPDESIGIEDDLIASVVDEEDDISCLSEVSPRAGCTPITVQAAGQVTFIDQFCRPLFESAVGYHSGAASVGMEEYGGLAELWFCLKTLESNREEWIRRRDQPESSLASVSDDLSEDTDYERVRSLFTPSGHETALISANRPRNAGNLARAFRTMPDRGEEYLWHSTDSFSSFFEEQSAGRRVSFASSCCGLSSSYSRPLSSVHTPVTAGESPGFDRDLSPLLHLPVNNHALIPESAVPAASCQRQHYHHVPLPAAALHPKGNRVSPSFGSDSSKLPVPDRQPTRRVSLPLLQPFLSSSTSTCNTADSPAFGLGSICEKGNEGRSRGGWLSCGLRSEAEEPQQRKHSAGLLTYLRKMYGRHHPGSASVPHQLDGRRQCTPSPVSSSDCVGRGAPSDVPETPVSGCNRTTGAPMESTSPDFPVEGQSKLAALLGRRRQSIPADWKVANRETVTA